MRFQLSFPVLAALLLAGAGDASAQPVVHLSPSFGTYGVTGGLGEYLSGGPQAGLELLVPRGNIQVGGGAELAFVGVDSQAGEGHFTRLALFGTGRMLLTRAPHVVPYLVGRVGWTRFTGDEYPAPPGISRMNPRQSGLEASLGVGFTMRPSPRVALDFSGSAGLLELGLVHVDSNLTHETSLPSAPSSGTGFSAQVGIQVGV